MVLRVLLRIKQQAKRTALREFKEIRIRNSFVRQGHRNLSTSTTAYSRSRNVLQCDSISPINYQRKRIIFDQRRHFSSQDRSHYCGQLNTTANVGDAVRLSGWLEKKSDFGKFCFGLLRDESGAVQLIAENKEIQDKLSSISIESVIYVTGTLIFRPGSNENEKFNTGTIEVQVEDLEVLNSAVLPFVISNERILPKEDFRLKHRYVDLRRKKLNDAIRVRSKLAHVARNFFHDEGFIEIETPTLFRATPEGANEYLVPTKKPGYCYALPQSPQQYKQLLMAGGFEKYFQFARCYRDEDLRADRQPEFTQIDFEMAFVDEMDIRKVVENLLIKIWKEVGYTISLPIRTMSYQDAMENYGTDKPDLTFGMKLYDVSESVDDYIRSKCYQNAEDDCLLAFRIPKGCRHLKKFSALQEIAAEENKKLMMLKSRSDGFKGFFPSAITKETVDNLTQKLSIEEDDLVILMAGNKIETLKMLGKCRLAAAKILDQLNVQFRTQEFAFLWVDQFPLFENEDGALVSTHHPFTSPVPEDIDMLFDSPEKVRGLHYDIVVNGVELGGGSVRIHDAKIQDKVFTDILKADSHKFQHLLNGLNSGCPPHAGLAIGFDRLLSVLLKTNSIRDVIAFPKSFRGKELMTDGPSKIADDHFESYGLQLVTEEKTD